jgi:hypothetical protein
MKLARIKRVTAVARLRGRACPGLDPGSTREARRVGVPATYSVLAGERAPTPTLPREERERSAALQASI